MKTMDEQQGHFIPTHMKYNEILKKILEIPLEKWNGYEAELNGKKVIFNSTHTNLHKFFTIDGVEFYGEGVNEFKYKLADFNKEKAEKLMTIKIDELHALLCGCPQNTNQIAGEKKDEKTPEKK